MRNIQQRVIRRVVKSLLGNFPSLRPHSAKSGKESQWATSEMRILIISPQPAQRSPAVCAEDITATRVILTTTSRVGLTAPVRLERRITGKNYR